MHSERLEETKRTVKRIGVLLVLRLRQEITAEIVCRDSWHDSWFLPAFFG